MAAHVRTVVVSEADRRELRRRARNKGAPARVVERARIAAGKPVNLCRANMRSPHSSSTTASDREA